jgi:hypothetical protein
MLALIVAAWISTHDVRPLAEESWVTLPVSQLNYAPQPQALRLAWYGDMYDAQRVEQTARGWRALFHVRVSGPVQVYLDESVPAAAPDLMVKSGTLVCHRVTKAGETLWHVGQQLAGDNDPYLFVLALFAANRDTLDNNPDELRIGDELRCPKEQEFAVFSQMLPAERRATYRRLLAYGERLKRH